MIAEANKVKPDNSDRNLRAIRKVGNDGVEGVVVERVEGGGEGGSDVAGVSHGVDLGRAETDGKQRGWETGEEGREGRAGDDRQNILVASMVVASVIIIGVRGMPLGSPALVASMAVATMTFIRVLSKCWRWVVPDAAVADGGAASASGRVWRWPAVDNKCRNGNDPAQRRVI